MARVATTRQAERPTEPIEFDPFSGFVLEVPFDAHSCDGFLHWATTPSSKARSPKAADS